MFGQQVLNGLSVGLVYGLLAIGLVMVFSTTKIVNFAHGELFSLGAFVGLALQRQFHFPFPIAGLASAGLTFLFAGAFAYLLIAKMRDPLTQSVATIALGFGLRDLMLVLFGSDSEAYPRVYPEGAYSIIGLRIPYASIIISLVAVGTLGLVAGFLWKTRWGIFARAVAQNPTLARTCGISSRSFQGLAFGGGAALAAIAGVLVSPQWQVSYSGGASVGLKAFTAALIGGFHSATGTLLGGLLVGLLEAFIAGYLSSTWKDLGVYICLLLVLVFFPKGLHSSIQQRLG